MEPRIDAEISIPLISICVLICTISTVILISQIYGTKRLERQSSRGPRASKQNNTGDHLVAICVIASTLCEYGDLTRWIISYPQNKSPFFYPLNQIMTIADLFYYIACISFYSIAVSRIYYAFQGSAYEISSRVIRLYMSLIIISVLAGLWHCVVASIQPEHGQDQFFAKYGVPAIVVLMINDFLLNAGLMILFVQKLKMVFNGSLISNSISENRSSIDAHSENFAHLIVRHSLLFGIAIITNQVFFVALILVFWGKGEVAENIHFMVFCCRSLENTANCLVLLLGMSKNHWIYNKCCGKLHNGFTNCFIDRRKRILSMGYMNMKEDSNGKL